MGHYDEQREEYYAKQRKATEPAIYSEVCAPDPFSGEPDYLMGKVSTAQYDLAHRLATRIIEDNIGEIRYVQNAETGANEFVLRIAASSPQQFKQMVANSAPLLAERDAEIKQLNAELAKKNKKLTEVAALLFPDE
ncbi:hypothetical protein ACQU0X_08445 [Pseudovibrio ascidiaceicola]|uniref:hypothetical protein n=1 Tax=Pseudovibrio ascidiaceicola TaxID=285279 RepID=UPI003D369552